MSSIIEKRPLYSIGMASRLSGVPIETIRTWERRYQILTPTRTAGGHRKYTRENVELLKSLRVMTERGHRIGDLSDSDLPPEVLAAVAREVTSPPAASPARVEPKPDEAWTGAVIDAARRLSVDDLERELTRPWQSGDTRYATRAMLAVLTRAGDLWHEGRLEVAAEHLIERAITKRIFAALSLLPRPRGGREAVLACPPGELHEVALLASALALHEHGVAVTYLGANLPVRDLARAIDDKKPAFVVLAVTVPLAPTDLAELTSVLAHAQRGGTRVLIGGASADTVVARVPRAELMTTLDALDLAVA